MNPIYEKIELPISNSFKTFSVEAPSLDAPWHYHPEVELIYIMKGKGIRYVGDNIHKFEEGDLVLIGPNLPHCWSTHDGNPDNVEAIIIQLDEQFMESHFLQMPEMSSIKNILKGSKDGLLYYGSIGEEVGNKMKKMLSLDNFSKFIELLSILRLLADSHKKKSLSSPGYSYDRLSEEETTRVMRVFDYVMANFKTGIKLEDVAKLSEMTPPAFCRYFKQRTKKTFFTYVIEVKVRHASKLLAETNMPISSICKESGFNNASNFNRQFNKVKKISPLNFRKQYKRLDYASYGS